jgi:DNA-binding transcriptional regulator YbjK
MLPRLSAGGGSVIGSAPSKYSFCTSITTRALFSKADPPLQSWVGVPDALQRASIMTLTCRGCQLCSPASSAVIRETMAPTAFSEMSTEPVPRRPQGRGIQRRAAILDATLRLLGREGSAAVTHRSVAEEAGVPIAATTYYFSSKEDLLREALRLHAEREAERVAEAMRMLGEGPPTVEALAAHLADFVDYGLGAGRQALIAEYELLLRAARDPGLESLSRVFYDRIRGQLEETLTELGAGEPPAAAQLVMAAVAGLEVDNLATPTTRMSREELRQLIGRLLHSLLVPSS